ncbi:CoA transferase [Aeromicrobium sp. CF3.5]|uniref:CoA transferase n=1 Tax=Aeromicrobium sp. CF3.5 TaxID=3373078 RepID=UPI003EE67EBF
MTAAHPSPPPGPLAGLRIVELSAFVATPLCGMTLAQLGAEVIRVEPLGGAADRGRWPLADDGSSLYWTGLNRGKRALAVDLTRPEGRQLVADLVTEAGVLVTNTERWPELAPALLRERRPDLIHVLLTGRHDGSTAVDYTVQASTGFPLITGPDALATPVNHVLPAWDVAAGLYLTTGLLAADRERLHSGVGRDVRVALEDVAMATAGQLGYLAQAQLDPENPRARDGNHVYGTFGTDHVTRDGARYMLVALTPRQWSDLLAITGLGDVVASIAAALGADLDDEGERYRHRGVLAPLVSSWFGRLSADEVESALASTRVLWSRYRSFEDMVAPSGIVHDHPLFSTVDQPGAGRYRAPGSPVVLDGSYAPPHAAPVVGQDTAQVLADLGISSDDAASLIADGLVAGPAVEGGAA